MRPLTLRLEGFQGFLEPETIDFTNITSAAITGPVGAGKTSILDAITYALYGHSRTSTKDGVIHTHAKSMSVELDFALGEGIYRVRRTRARSGAAKTYLWHIVDGEPVAIGDGDGRTGATEEALAQLYPVSYETYRASVLVEQGKSDSFIEAKPSERHALMSEILELGQYKKLHEDAKVQLRSKKAEVARLDALLEGKDAAEVGVAETKEALAQAEKEHHRAEKEAAAAAKDLKAAQDAAAKARSDLNGARESNAAGEAALAEAAETARETASAYQSLVSEIGAIEGRISSGQQYVTDTQADLEAEGTRLVEHRDSLSRRYSDRFAHAEEHLTKLKGLAEAAAGQVREVSGWVSEAEEALVAANKALNNHRSEVQRLSNDREGLVKRRREETGRLATYQHGGQHDKNCHTCGQSLDEVMTARIVGLIQQEISGIDAEGKELRGKLDTATAVAESAEKEVASAQRRAAEAAAAATAAAGEEARLKAELSAAELAAQEAREVAADLQKANSLLAEHEAGISAGHSRLVKGRELLTNLTTQLNSLQGELTGAKTAADAAAQDLEATKEQHKLVDLTAFVGAESRAEEELERARTAANDSSGASIRAEGSVSAARAAAESAQLALDAFAQHAKERRAAREEQTILEYTAKAMSPTGVPQMMMNSALETMNVYLHQYLQDISGNVLTAELTTTLETKAGGSKNEINIQVTGDDGKPRLYESFSGGQKFLTDFALHMTNARILADRRGSVVDFCAVDEGWNSLEGEEKTAVLRAVQKLSDTYSLVMTVTHDDDVVNSMPQQIKVERVSGTSTVTVNS